MITYLYKTMSLGNLQRAGRGGQVATILLFIMVVILVFILVTANIGHLSLTSTNLANAADSASLYLASQLSTRSRIIFEALGNKAEYCKERGLLAFIGSIIGSLLLGPIGGAIGGGIGGAIDGSGFEQGLTTGFRIGLGMAGVILAGIPFGTIGIVTMTGMDIAAEIYNYRNKDKDMVKGMRNIARNLSGLDLAVQLRESTYLRALSQVVDDPNLVKDNGNDPRYPEFRGISDIDGDGNIEELASVFEYRMFKRTSQLAQSYAWELKSKISSFVKGPLKAFRNFAEKCVAAKGHLSRAEFTLPGNDGPIVSLARALNSYGIPPVSFWKPEPPPIEPYCLDSRRRLNDPIQWCDKENTKRNLHDPIDRVTAEFLSLIAIADEMKGLIENGELNEMAEEWLEWIGIFYYFPHDLDKIRGVDNDPDEDSAVEGGYYFGLDKLVNCEKSCVYDGSVAKQNCCEVDFVGMEEWKEELIGIRQSLKTCYTNRVVPGPRPRTFCDAPAYVGDTVCNPPCKIGSVLNIVGTVDNLLDDPDEFDKAIKAIGDINDIDYPESIIGRIRAFQEEILIFYNILKGLGENYLRSGIDGGVDPVVYSWHDSRCPGAKDELCHRGTVKTEFALPYIKKSKSSKEVCLKLRNGSGTATVTITREDNLPLNDPQRKERGVGRLGFWNYRGFGDKIIRKSRSKYSYLSKDSGRNIPYLSGIK